MEYATSMGSRGTPRLEKDFGKHGTAEVRDRARLRTKVASAKDPPEKGHRLLV